MCVCCVHVCVFVCVSVHVCMLCACVRIWNVDSQSKASLHVLSLSVSCLWYPLVGHTPQDKADS